MIPIAKTKALISFAVTVKLICVFVFAYAKKRFFHNEAHFMTNFNKRMSARLGNHTLVKLEFLKEKKYKNIRACFCSSQRKSLLFNINFVEHVKLEG